jgi:hypothetical protein
MKAIRKANCVTIAITDRTLTLEVTLHYKRVSLFILKSTSLNIKIITYYMMQGKKIVMIK